ncbi:MAG: UMP kinase, partial [Bacteroidales bacterium]
METIIISLGGSLIIPEEIDVDFLKDFKKLILSQIKLNKKFVIITGGGKLCRRYNEASKKISEVSNDNLDWLGIYSTRFNAEFVKTLFGDLAEDKIILDPTLPIKLDKSIIIGGGWRPGNSTDLVAVMIGKQLNAKKMINLSNTDYVYDSDPKINPNAKKFAQISWPEYRKLIPKEWNPGLNSPFDPVA